MQLDDMVRELVHVETEPMRQRLADLERQLAELRSKNRLLTVEEFCEAHPEWTEGAVRWLVFHREERGLETAIIQPTGKRGRVKIDPEEFLRITAGKRRRSTPKPRRRPRAGTVSRIGAP